jgi:hypothetical protein
MKTIFLTLVLLLAATQAPAQKKELIQDKATILARAGEAFDAWMQPGSDLYEKVQKENLTGTYVLQISFGDKGDITSVFVESAENKDIRSQNRFKDLIHECRLPFKMPKGRQYRVEHSFNLTAIPR